MFKSKHSGWTWDLKRTPFGGGGGGFISSITDPISSALGTSGGGGGALGALASVDPTKLVGPATWGSSGGDFLASIDPSHAISQGLTSVDKAVNQIPGGWYTVGGLAAGGTGLYFAPEIAAAAGIGEGTAITSAAGQQAFFDALAGGAASTEAINAGVAADALAAGAATGGVDDVFAGLSANAPVDTAASQAAAGVGATGAAGGAGGAAGIVSNPVTPEMIAAANASSDPIGMMSYLTSATPEELAAATGPGAGASSDLASALKTANQVRQVASTANSLSKLLTQGAGSGLSSSLGQLAKGANPQGQALTSLVRGNTNPFAYTAQQPIRNATTPDLASLASLLKQG